MSLIELLHFSIASLIVKLVSLMTGTVQGPNVRSPAIGRTRPLNGTGIFPRFEAGISAALT